MAASRRTTPVYLEVGAKKVFACSLDWPGWARAGRSEEAALDALLDYSSRYAVVAEEAAVPFPAGRFRLELVERVPGTGITDFGAPGEVTRADARPWSAREGKRQGGLVAASWRVLDRVVSGAPPTLRKGPRGGGRDRDQMVAHVVEAERAYARMIGVRHPPLHGDPEALAALRADVLAVLARRSTGEPPRAKGWPVRYAARRIGWHVLDHAWEIEDKS